MKLLNQERFDFLKLRNLKIFLFVSVFITTAFFLNAQRQYENWQFGNGVIARHTPSASPLVSGPPAFPSGINTPEGCASWSNPITGQRMYYTDGITIWNGLTDLPTPNPPMNGNPNGPINMASQGVIIIPISTTLHYIYIVSDNGPQNFGITQYAFDPSTLTLISGPTHPLQNYASTEMLTAVPDCQGGYWLIIKPVSNSLLDYPMLPNPGPPILTFGMNCLLAYRVGAAGISNVPIASPSGPFTTSGINALDYVGTMKFSPNREYLGVAERETTVFLPPVGPWVSSGFIHLYRFNRGAGTFVHITTVPQNNTTYGLSFSPNSNLLYAQFGVSIRRYDLEPLLVNSCPILPLAAPNFSTSSSGLFPPVTPIYFQLQLGQDRDLYWAKPGTSWLGGFTNPDNLALPGNVANYIPLNTPQVCRTGLPNHMDGFSDPLTEFRFCVENCFDVCFEPINSCNPAGAGTVTWDFGDGTSITGLATNPIIGDPANAGTYNNPCHKYATLVASAFTVSLTINGVFQSSHVVNVSGINNWHQQTNDAALPPLPLVGAPPSQGDKGEDVVIDGFNNIYVCGTFTGSTKFNDGINPPVNISANAAGTAYLAKYNSCGELLWVNYDFMGHSRGKAIAIDEKRNLIYMTGDYGGLSGTANFLSVPQTPIGPPPVSGAPISGGKMYIASFSMITGGLVNSYTSIGPADLFPTSICAIKYTPTSTQLFVCGYNQISTGPPVFEKGFVINFIDAGVITPGWTQGSTNASGSVRVNDITYNSNEDKLYVVGDVNTTFGFSGTTVLTPCATSEAFILSLNRLSGAWGGFLRNDNYGVCGAGPYYSSTAQSVTFDDVNDRVYIAGSLNGIRTVNKFFGLAGLYDMPNNGSKAYVIGINHLTFPYTMVYRRQIKTMSPTAGHFANGTGAAVTSNGTKVILYGDWLGSSANPLVSTNPAVLLPNGAYTSPAGFKKLFMVAFDWNMSINTIWDNTTKSIAGSTHHSSKVAANDNFAMYTGAFRSGDMGYTYDVAPVSAPLAATSLPAGNTFLLKGDLTSTGLNGLRYATLEESNEDLVLNEKLNSLVQPNPTSGIFKVVFPSEKDGMPFKISVVDIQGKVIISKTIINKVSENEIDLSSFGDGLYILNVDNGEKRSHTKIIKQ